MHCDLRVRHLVSRVPRVPPFMYFPQLMRKSPPERRWYQWGKFLGKLESSPAESVSSGESPFTPPMTHVAFNNTQLFAISLVQPHAVP